MLLSLLLCDFDLFDKYLTRACKNNLAWLEYGYELATLDVDCLVFTQTEGSCDFLIPIIHDSYLEIDVVIPNCLIQWFSKVLAILDIIVELGNLLVLKKSKFTLLHLLKLTLYLTDADLINFSKTLSSQVISPLNILLLYLLF
jgi:hypothetical protein